MIELKRGDTFKRTMRFKDKDGTPIVVDNIRSQIRNKSMKLIDELVITATGEPGEYILSSADTSGYPIEKLQMDIEITVGDVTKSSNTIKIQVNEDCTYG